MNKNILISNLDYLIEGIEDGDVDVKEVATKLKKMKKDLEEDK